MTTKTFERRIFPAQDVKIIRADDKTGTLKFRGRPWVYGQLSDDLGGWQEIIEQGAATRTLAGKPDCRFLLNHDANFLMARTLAGTLTLSEDDEGGWADADMANVSYARDLAVLIERGDLTQMSFGFWITSDEWAGNLHRVHSFDLDGGDVSAVTFPAFPQTSVELRAKAAEALGHAVPEPVKIQRAAGGPDVVRTVADFSDEEAVALAFPELRAGKVLSSVNRDLVCRARDALTELLDKTQTSDDEAEHALPGVDAYPRDLAERRCRVLEASASL